MIPKKTKHQVTPEEIEEARQEELFVAEFMVLTECEGVCEVGTALADARRHCRRMDTVIPVVYVGDGTREGKPFAMGRICMKHLPKMIGRIKREAPGGNGAEFK